MSGPFNRLAAAFLVGLVLCLAIWVAVPYNNFVLNNSFVSDGYLPEIVLLCVLILVLAVNPLLRRFLPRCALSHNQLALIGGMLLFAAVLPSNGLYRFFPYCVAHDVRKINASPDLATGVRDSALPPALFPDAIGPEKPTPVSDGLIAGLDPGAAIPWGAWLKPFLAWGSVVAGLWIMMLGLGAIVYPQWRTGEKLAFPLLKAYHAVIDEPAAGTLVPPVFRSRLFWAGCGVVMVLHSMNGLAVFTDGAFPKFPLSWDISGAFTEGMWRYAPTFIKSSRIYFVFIGLAYFMQNRYSFSIWFTLLAFAVFSMITTEYMPTFEMKSPYNLGRGALIVITIGVAWLGRFHYARVLRAVFRRAESEEDRTNALAGRMFLLGCAILFGWFVWAGAGAGWSLYFVVMGVAIMFLVARIVAETGLTYVWILPLTAASLMAFVPAQWHTVGAVFLAQAHYILVNRASAVSVAVMMMLSLGLDRNATPQAGRRLAGVGLTVLLLGLLVCGAVHLHMGYTHPTSYDGKNAPVTGSYASQMMNVDPVRNLITNRSRDVPASKGSTDMLPGMLWGGGLAAVLMFLCSRLPGWPLHPIGLIFIHSSIGLRLSMSLFLGWVIKGLLVHYGGARAYDKAMPLFLGLMLGEMFANVLWTLIPVVQILLGADPATVHHLTIFQYS